MKQGLKKNKASTFPLESKNNPFDISHNFIFSNVTWWSQVQVAETSSLLAGVSLSTSNPCPDPVVVGASQLGSPFLKAYLFSILQ